MPLRKINAVDLLTAIGRFDADDRHAAVTGFLDHGFGGKALGERKRHDDER
jgi:hypothetical protein